MSLAAESSPRPAESLRQQVRRAVLWRSGSQIAGQLIAWASTFVVIRLLSPGDYGLVAMTGVVLLLLNMLNGHGLANALIQQGDAGPRAARQVLGMLVCLNLTLGAIQLAAAPLVAAYYREPMVADLLRVQAILYLTTPYESLSYALLARRMDFRRQAQVNLLSSVLAAITAFAGAASGMGVWTLVLAPIVLFATRAIGLTVAARAWMLPLFDFRGAGALARYGSLVAGASLLGFAQSQADVLIAGRLFDAHGVGVYTTALFLTQIFTNKVIPPLNEVAFSAYARMQHDRDAIAAGFGRAAGVIMAAAVPFFLGLAVAAEPVVALALGPQWGETVPLVRLLAVAMPFMAMQTLFPPAVDAMGRPGTTAITTAIGAMLLPVLFLAGAQWGIAGVAAAWIVGHPILCAVAATRALPVIGLSLADLVRCVAPAFVSGTVMAGAAWAAGRAVAPTDDIYRLLAMVAAGAATYGVSMLLIGRGTIRDAVAMARRG